MHIPESYFSDEVIQYVKIGSLFIWLGIKSVMVVYICVDKHLYGPVIGKYVSLIFASIRSVLYICIYHHWQGRCHVIEFYCSTWDAVGVFTALPSEWTYNKERMVRKFSPQMSY